MLSFPHSALARVISTTNLAVEKEAEQAASSILFKLISMTTPTFQQV